MLFDRPRYRPLMLSFFIAGLMLVATPRRSPAETLLDFKTLYYEEDHGRIKVIAPSAAYQTELGDGLTIRLEGIYNSISGATPTGAPPAPVAKSAAPAPVIKKTVKPVIVPGGGDDGDDEDEEEEDKGARLSSRSKARASSIKAPVSSKAFNSLSGATPPPTPPPTPTPTPKPSKPGAVTPAPAPSSGSGYGEAPLSDFDETREAINLDLSYRMGRHTPGVALSYSHEEDYLSQGVAVKDAIDFNQKNTTLLLGVGGTFDELKPSNGVPKDNKETYDLMVGVTQVLNPLTVMTVNATVGRTQGLLSDPYKVVELNGSLVPENRPDSKNKQILFGSLSRYIEALEGSVEGAYRFYNDDFGIQAHTVSLAWYQKLGPHWMVRPLIRYYTQSEADFYAVRFTGSPQDYSSDYRISELSSLGGGLKVIWSPNSRLSLDASYERYEQWGLDNVTSDDLYPSANVIMVGVRLWF